MNIEVLYINASFFIQFDRCSSCLKYPIIMKMNINILCDKYMFCSCVLFWTELACFIGHFF